MATTPSEDAEYEAKDAVESYLEEIVEKLADEGEADKGLDDYDRDYFDSMNQSYRLLEAAQILTDLSQFEETDSGLWEGLSDPQEAVIAQAVFTYRNAVSSYFNDEMETVNDDVGPVAQGMMDERASLERQIESFEDIPERDDAQEASLDALQIRLEAFVVNRKKRLKNLVLEAIGRRKKARGPKDWNP